MAVSSHSSAPGIGLKSIDWPFVIRALMWFLGAGVGLFLFARDLSVMENGSLLGRAFWGRDFVIWWTAGQLVREGAIATIYDLAGIQAQMVAYFGPLEPMGYPYPPVTFPIAFLLGALPYWLAQPTSFIVTGGLFVYACRPWWNTELGPRWLALVTPAALVNIWAGHYGFLIGALFLLGWGQLDRNPKAAGFFFGCMLIKPHLAILIPIALLLRRSWVAFFSAAATTLLLIAGSALLYGADAWRDYLVNMTGPQISVISYNDTLFTFMATSTTTAMLRLTSSGVLAWCIQLAVSAAAIATLVAASRHRPATLDLAMLVATLTFLTLPYGFNYDLTVVMVGALAVFARADIPVKWRVLAAAAFVAPTVGMAFALLGMPFMPVALAGLAYVQYQVAARSPTSNVAFPALGTRALA